MANVIAERDGLVDDMPRDERGYWKPDKEIGAPNPVFSWPPRPRAVAKWVKATCGLTILFTLLWRH